MSTHQIHVFISHLLGLFRSLTNTLEDWIFREEMAPRSGIARLSGFFGSSKNDPIHNASTDRALRGAIFNKIARSHVIVIPLGMYANYSKWIRKEIDGAQSYAKPILGVNPWGQERKSSVVAAAAKETVGWNSKSVVGGIWRLYRG